MTTPAAISRVPQLSALYLERSVSFGYGPGVPRAKQFDPDVALDAAMRLFWAQGYEATSMADLVDHLGVAKASLYATFGSKRALYIRALDRYMAGGAGPTPEELLSRPGSPLAAVRELMTMFATLPLGDQPRGCLTVNATVECTLDDRDITSRLQANRARLESALYMTLLRARAHGEIGAQSDPRALAQFLVVVANGMQVLARAGADEGPRLTAAAEQALSVLS